MERHPTLRYVQKISVEIGLKQDVINALVFSADGNTLAIGTAGRMVYLYDLSTDSGQTVAGLPDLAFEGFESCLALQWIQKETLLAGFEDGIVFQLPSRKKLIATDTVCNILFCRLGNPISP